MSWENILKNLGIDPERDGFEGGAENREEMLVMVYNDLGKLFKQLSESFKGPSDSNSAIRDLNDLPEFMEWMQKELQEHIDDIKTWRD